MHLKKNNENPVPVYPLTRWAPLGDVFHVSVAERTRVAKHTLYHTHDYAEVTCVRKGLAVHYCSEGEREVLPGGIVFIRPQHRHALRPDVDGTVLCNVMFTAQQLNLIAERYFEHNLDFWAPVSAPFCYDAGDKADKIFALYDQSMNEPKTPFYLDRFILNLLTLLDRGPVQDSHRQAPDWLRKAVELLRKPEVFVEGLDAFFTLCERTPNHVARVCRQFYGCTPGRLLQQARAEHAARLLVETNNDIMQIAMDVGYADLSLFYRQFKKVFSISPAKYRKSKK